MRPRGLRGRVALTFGLGAFLLSAMLAVSTFLITRDYLVNQRERSALVQAYRDAGLIRVQLETEGIAVPDVLDRLIRPESGALIVQHRGEWYSSSPFDAGGRTVVPTALRDRVRSGEPAYIRTEIDGQPAVVVGLPLPAVNAEFFRVTSLAEINNTLRTLAAILGSGAALAAIGGAALGLWASRKVVQPLNAVAAATAEIAGGRLDTRLAPTTDPDLATIVGSFNAMVDSLHQRIERDARFAADVSHELRSPLTTLVASVEVLDRRRSELPQRSRQALDLVKEELGRFRRLLDNLLSIARADAGLDVTNSGDVPLYDLLSRTLSSAGLSADLLEGERHVVVRGDRNLLDRAFGNLIENAERHGNGLTGITIMVDEARVLTLIDDEGPGVPITDRDRIFERFATSKSARGSSSGTGLGLALVSETITAHGGAVWCTDRPGGGARFVVSLPRADS